MGTLWDDYLRAAFQIIRGDLATKGADIASASTTDLGAIQGLLHDITGTTTITSFGTVAAGIWKMVKYEGALTITHNATSLILLGAENRTTADGDTQILISEGSGNWREVAYFPVAINPGKSVSTDETQTLTNKTLTSPVINAATIGIGTGSGTGTTVAVADVQTTVVGNVGVGTDDLMSYTLPANSLSANKKAIRVTAWGAGANNANAKQVAFFFGSILSSVNLDISVAVTWRFEAIVVRTGSGAQKVSVFWYFNTGATGSANQRGSQVNTTGAVTDTATITVKAQAVATADNDVTQEGMIVEFLN